MTQMVFVTPASGARVRMPDRNSQVMGEAGAWVPRTVHYEALIAAGDVLIADPQPPMPGAAPRRDRRGRSAEQPHTDHPTAAEEPQSETVET